MGEIVYIKIFSPPSRNFWSRFTEVKSDINPDHRKAIGDYSIVSARAVAVKDVLNKCIAGVIPAKSGNGWGRIGKNIRESR